MHTRIHMGVRVYVYGCMCVCVCVCMCMYVCVYVCICMSVMYVCVCMEVWVCRGVGPNFRPNQAPPNGHHFWRLNRVFLRRFLDFVTFWINPEFSQKVFIFSTIIHNCGGELTHLQIDQKPSGIDPAYFYKVLSNQRIFVWRNIVQNERRCLSRIKVS